MRRRSTVTITLMVLCTIFFSCGKKGDPFLSSKQTPDQVTDFEGAWNGEDVLLTGRIPEPMKVREGDGCRIYYAAYPLDSPPCEGCPIEYNGYLSFGRELLTGDMFSYKVPGIRRGQLYFFEIRPIGNDGSPGPSSDTVSVEVPKAN
jgi:hypothetical protein